MASDLFEAAGLETAAPQPLAERLRPSALSDVAGQDHLLAAGAPIRRMLDAGRLTSFILWGPPGVGKTTIARAVAGAADLEFEQVSAVFSGVAELRAVFERARARRATGRGTLLFVDEIHRFNRAQQDAFLPNVESGLVTLIGATTENPSFELNPALLSRAQVFQLKPLDAAAIETLLARAEEAAGRPLPLKAAARARLVAMADGDGRYALNLAEELLAEPPDRPPLDAETLLATVGARAPVYDKSGEAHYNLASALQKSIRGSDPDAALYWAARMLDGGEDPRFILRRLVVTASEDIGNADPAALPLAIAARDAYEFLGRPEGDIAIGQLTAYLASAPKSNRAHIAFKAAKTLAREAGALAPPPHAMSAPTRLMKDLGYAEGYVYDHNAEDGFAGLNYFPPGLPRRRLYEPCAAGAEKEISMRLESWARRRKGDGEGGYDDGEGAS